METTFFGLYGTASPLPSFYTEELFDDEWEDDGSARGFLDIFHYQLYPLLYEAWKKYRFNLNTIEYNNEKYWSILYSLIGLDQSLIKQVKDAGQFVKYAGILGIHPKSAMGLQTILADLIPDIDVQIDQCVARKVKISSHQKLKLGLQNSQLGDNSVLGETVDDAMGQFKVILGPVKHHQFEQLLNNSALVKQIKSLIKLYLIQPLTYHIELTLVPGEERNVTLGNNSQLGQSTWVGVTRDMPQYSVRLT